MSVFSSFSLLGAARQSRDRGLNNPTTINSSNNNNNNNNSNSNSNNINNNYAAVNGSSSWDRNDSRDRVDYNRDRDYSFSSLPQSLPNTLPVNTDSLSVYNSYSISEMSASIAQAPADFNMNMSVHSAASEFSAWRELRSKVLPLFNGEGLRGSIEELNEAVSDWLVEASARSANVRLDFIDLVTSGAVVLGKKMVILDEANLLPRLLDLWTFFHGTVVPYVDGVFVPLKEMKDRVRSTDAAATAINVRALTLIAFRDQILWPLVPRIEVVLPRIFNEMSDRRFADVSARCIQMLSVLQSVRSVPKDEKAQKCQQLVHLTRECMKLHEGSVKTGKAVHHIQT
ncbi:hypothetical protein HDU84_007504 [Entophlyctis sp. JEL0112]|nr:hypothetical protein HDU84_007504 [Entophlyctis sp. JEL0112]